MSNLLKAFSNITRIKILASLSTNSENVSCLIKTCQLSQSAVSQHLKKLKDIGAIEYEVLGRDRIYKLKNQEIGQIAQKILKIINNH